MPLSIMKNEQELKKIFGENIKARRERLGLTQERLAEKAFVSNNTISDIESGDKFARSKTLVNLAKALDTDVYELMKPQNVSPDKAADIIAQYTEKIRMAVGEIERTYIADSSQE